MALLSVFLVGLLAGASGEACAEGASEEQSLLSLPRKIPAGQLQSSSSEEANGTSDTSQRPRSSKGMIRYDNSWSDPNNNNFCLSVTNNDFVEGTSMQLWDCVGSSGQDFTVWEEGGQNQLSIGGHDVGFRYGMWNGAGAQLDNGAPWKFYWDGGGKRPGMLKPVNRPDMCLTVDGNKAYNGAKVQLWKCHEGREDQKRWSLQEGGSTHAPCAHAGQDVWDDYTFKGHTPVECCDGKPAANYNGKMLCPGGPTHAPSPSTHAPCAHAGQDVWDDYTFKGHTPVKCCDGKPAANYGGKMLCPGQGSCTQLDHDMWATGTKLSCCSGHECNVNGMLVCTHGACHAAQYPGMTCCNRCHAAAPYCSPISGSCYEWQKKAYYVSC